MKAPHSKVVIGQNAVLAGKPAKDAQRLGCRAQIFVKRHRFEAFHLECRQLVVHQIFTDARQIMHNVDAVLR